MPRTRESELNRAAADYLRRARESLAPARNRTEFASELGDAMGINLTPGNYGLWEKAVRSVPAAAIFAAFRLSGLPVADPVGERTLAERLQRLEEGLEDIQRELRSRREIRLIGSGALHPGAPQP